MASFPSARRLAPLVLTSLLALAGSAQAAVNVSPVGSSLQVSDFVGPMSVLIDTDGAGHYTFAATGLTAGAPCSPLSGTPTKCPADGIDTIFVGGTPGNDFVNASNSNSVLTELLVLGQAGADTLTTGASDDSISGGLGDDILNGYNGDDLVTDEQGFSNGGGGGNDTLRGGFGDDRVEPGVLGAGVAGATSGGGHDLLDGGSGVDTVDYGKRTAPVIITVDSPGNVSNLGNDGEAGENDNVINAEHVIGGSAGDTITGSGIFSQLDGGPGNDTLNGGDAGNVLSPGFGADTVNGGAVGDTVLAQDGEVDTITCGGGSDVVQADGFDNVAADCETVTRTAAITLPGQTNTVTVEVPTPVPPQAGPVLSLPKTLKADSKGRVKVTVGCPKATKAGCLFGTLTLTTAPKKGKGRKVASGVFTLRPGKTAKVSLTLSATARKSLKKSRKLAVVLAATAINGDVQARTTTATLTVKR